MKYCKACGACPTDRCHIRSRGAGGPNDEFNLIDLCRRCHTEQHKVGWNSFLAKFPHVKEYLHDGGWEIIECTGSPTIQKLWHPLLAEGNANG